MANKFISYNLYKPEGMTIYRMWQWTHFCQLKNVFFFCFFKITTKKTCFLQVKLFHFSEKMNKMSMVNQVLYYFHTILIYWVNKTETMNSTWTEHRSFMSRNCTYKTILWRWFHCVLHSWTHISRERCVDVHGNHFVVKFVFRHAWIALSHGF